MQQAKNEIILDLILIRKVVGNNILLDQKFRGSSYNMTVVLVFFGLIFNKQSAGDFSPVENRNNNTLGQSSFTGRSHSFNFLAFISGLAQLFVIFSSFCPITGCPNITHPTGYCPPFLKKGR